MSLNSKQSSLIAAAVASSVSSSETGVAADVELELSPPLDDAIAAPREEGGVGASARRVEISLTHFGDPLVRLNLLLLEFVIVLLKERGEELEVDVSRAPGGGREDVLP